MNRSLALGFVSLSIACGGPQGRDAGHDGPPTPEEASKFIDGAEAQLKEAFATRDRTDWVNMTYITDDTEWLASRSTEMVMELTTNITNSYRRFATMQLPDEVARKFKLLRVAPTLPAPADAALRRELATVTTELTSMYGKGKYCPPKGECIDLNAITKIMAESRDYDRLLEVWNGWHSIAPPMRDKYARFVALGNQGAQEMGFADLGELWRSRYDMTPAEFEGEGERLWQQVKPFYESLHCYVRKKLSAKYGAAKVPKTGPIPAHVLGNMWAQEWSNVYPLVEPYPGQASIDVTAALERNKYDATKMMKTGESFFTSLGMPALPETFWQRSMLTKPKDREVVCHASAWDVGMSGDVRVKMCTETNEEDLQTIHHELGHVYYYLMYGKLSPLFQDGAHDGFHEGIGDTLVLSMTPGYLKQLGLLSSVSTNEKAETNNLMKRALDKVAFLPFGKLVDQWRWEVFDGRIKPSDYNAGWWRLRTQYQGIAPASPRDEANFDPGAKYHIPGNTPYARYFLAHILQFQFHRALCRASGFTGPLHQCSIYGSKAAGERLMAMLAMGASRPWPEALAAISGETTMDASALAEYFQPLKTWLDTENKGETCGW
jgi:peptidyl-dipeptidase A